MKVLLIMIPLIGNEIIGINGNLFLWREYLSGIIFFMAGILTGTSYSRAYFFMPPDNYRNVCLGCVFAYFFMPRVNSRCVCLGCVFVYFFMPRVNHRDVCLGCAFVYFFMPRVNYRCVCLGCV